MSDERNEENAHIEANAEEEDEEDDDTDTLDDNSDVSTIDDDDNEDHDHDRDGGDSDGHDYNADDNDAIDDNNPSDNDNDGNEEDETEEEEENRDSNPDEENDQVDGNNSTAESEEDDVELPAENVEIVSKSERYYKHFKTYGSRISVKISPPAEGTSLSDWLGQATSQIHKKMISDYDKSDFIGVTCARDDFAGGPVWLSFRSLGTFNPSDISDLLFKVSQSNSDFNVNEPFILDYAVVKGTQGGRDRNKLSLDSARKKSVLTINNIDDDLCLPRALAALKVYLDRGELRQGPLHDEWMKIRKCGRGYQKEKAEKLVRDAGVDVRSGGCDLDDVAKFQKYLGRFGYAIIVFNWSGLGGEDPRFNGADYTLQKFGRILHRMYISYDDDTNHFEPILNIVGAAGAYNFCELCFRSYRELKNHRCGKACKRCYRSTKCSDEGIRFLTCNDCNRVFAGETCFNYHLKPNSYSSKSKHLASVCSEIRLCRRCCRRLDKSANHVCGQVECSNCRKMVGSNHLCHMQPRANNCDKKNILFIFYDFESRQDEKVPGTDDTFLHIPNLCVVQQACTVCIESPDISQWCQNCGIREHVFSKDPVKQFVEYAVRPKTNFSKIICIAHNSKAYDAIFILKYIIENEKIEPELIMNGSKITKMEVYDTIFIDSLNYFHMPLSKLPSAFDIAECKGFFPHFFNTRENENYVGALPEEKYFGYNTMSVSDRDKFLSWYRKLKSQNYIFNFKEEILKYCRADVSILRQACLSFRKIFVQTGNVCPFSEACTIASACNLLYRKNYLKPNTIGIIPPGGYRLADKQSDKALKWLLFQEIKNGGIKIQNSRRGREVRLDIGFLVDGYYEDSETGEKIVYQFYGCWFHGCEKCFPNNRDKEIHKGQSMATRYERTTTISTKIRNSGYTLIEAWECEFDNYLKNHISDKEMLDNHPRQTNPLDPRDAFYGGRTGNISTFYETKGDEKIRYIDICSLYPWVSKCCKFPVSHPTIYIDEECDKIVGPENNIQKVEGLISCRVLAPRDLFHPLLPVKTGKYLMFPLCRTCAVEMRDGPCDHEDKSERWFNGVWVADELRKAVSLGYEILKVFEIWQYDMIQYDKVKGTVGLFDCYINAFLKYKQEASGWPLECTCENKKKKYIQDYFEVENIRLDEDKICKNAGLRSVAKICLNCFWGKFGQRPNLQKTKIIRTRTQLLELLFDHTVEVSNVLPATATALYATYVNHKDAVEPSVTSNVVIAAYTTAHARLKLYSYIEKLGKRVLYFDTDSVIYVSKPGDYEPPTGNFLGEMTCELTGPYGEGSYIKFFTSAGPKVYAYIVQKPDGSTEEVCKAKGVTLNFENRKYVNYNLLEEFAKYGRTAPLELEFNSIRRTPLRTIVTKREKKTVKPVLKKRQFSGFSSHPYGFHHACNDCD